jgi:hypothetical protein
MRIASSTAIFDPYNKITFVFLSLSLSMIFILRSLVFSIISLILLPFFPMMLPIFSVANSYSYLTIFSFSETKLTCFSLSPVILNNTYFSLGMSSTLI